MLIIKTTGDDLVIDLDVDEHNNIPITTKKAEPIIIIDDPIETQKNSEQKQKNTSIKKTKKQHKATIKCTNKFFKNLTLESDSLEICQNQTIQGQLNFGTTKLNPSISEQQLKKQVQNFQSLINWTDKTNKFHIPEKILDEDQELQLFIPKIKGINNSISNTLFLNNLKSRNLKFTEIHPQIIEQKKEMSQRDQYMTELKKLQQQRLYNMK